MTAKGRGRQLEVKLQGNYFLKHPSDLESLKRLGVFGHFEVQFPLPKKIKNILLWNLLTHESSNFNALHILEKDSHDSFISLW